MDQGSQRVFPKETVRKLPDLREVYQDIRMVDCREELFQQVGSKELQAGGVNAGMAANIFMAVNNRLVDQQLVQKAISTHFPGKAAGRVRRPACM